MKTILLTSFLIGIIFVQRYSCNEPDKDSSPESTIQSTTILTDAPLEADETTTNEAYTENTTQDKTEVTTVTDIDKSTSAENTVGSKVTNNDETSSTELNDGSTVSSAENNSTLSHDNQTSTSNDNLSTREQETTTNASPLTQHGSVTLLTVFLIVISYVIFV